MLTIQTKGNSLYRFNMRSPVQEKVARDAWWAMSDIPNKQGTKIKMVTDLGEVYSIAVGDITQMIYDEHSYEYPDESLVAKTAGLTGTTGGDLVDPDEPLESMSALLDELAKILDTMYSSLPDKYRQAAEMFLKVLQDTGMQPDIQDPLFRVAIVQAMRVGVGGAVRVAEEYIVHKSKSV